ENLLEQIGPALKPGAIVSDVGSTKASVVSAAERILPEGVHFVGSHPMAGSEKRGVEFARTDLLHNALCILTPTERTDRAALSRVQQFWQTLGMRTTQMPPEEHDARLADVSHLPHVLAAALVAIQEDLSLDLCGKGFLDTTRIAGGDGDLWRDILLDNRVNLRNGIERMRAQLQHVLGLIDSADGEALSQWLQANADRRSALAERKLREWGE